MKSTLLKITTDGSCHNKPGNEVGGYGIVMRYGAKTKEIVGGPYHPTTSARMEIQGVLSALQAIKPGFRTEIYCDNQYVVYSISKGWAYNWRSQGWEGRVNADLWKQVLEELERFPKGSVTLHWVKGHSTDEDNNRCDALANLGRSRQPVTEPKI